jgi:hypothetical protein
MARKAHDASLNGRLYRFCVRHAQKQKLASLLNHIKYGWKTLVANSPVDSLSHPRRQVAVAERTGDFS